MRPTFAFALVGILAAGCSSVQVGREFGGMTITSSRAAPLAHLNGHVGGIYILGFLPVLTGSASPAGSVVLFSDTVRVHRALEMVSSKARELQGGRLEDLASSRESTWLFPTVILWWKSVEVSASAVK